MAERWRQVPGWGGLYSVSDQGRVRAEARTVVTVRGVEKRRAARILKGSPHPHGYVKVQFKDAGRVEWISVHRLVALVFMGAPTGPVVRHLDGNPKNNAVENLAYGTVSDNVRDTVRMGRYRNGTSDATECIHGHPYDDENTYWRPDGSRLCKACGRAWADEHREEIRARSRARYAARKGQA